MLSLSFAFLYKAARASLGGSDGKESACNTEDPCSIPGSGRSTGEGIGYPLQYPAAAAAAAAKLLQSCPTLCDPTDGSPSGSTIPGILQARTLEWVALSFLQWI